MARRTCAPAWFWGLGALILTGLTAEIDGRMQLAGSLVTLVAAGSPGALIEPFVQHLPTR